MSESICPGKLVVRRSRWSIDGLCLGIVLGQRDDEWTVMWTSVSQLTTIGLHIEDALLVIDEKLELNLEDRCQTSV